MVEIMKLVAIFFFKFRFLATWWPYLWPVGRSQNLVFFNSFFSLYRNDVENAGEKKKSRKCEKKCINLALISSPGRWTGNKFIFKGGLATMDSIAVYILHDSSLVFCGCILREVK